MTLLHESTPSHEAPEQMDGAFGAEVADNDGATSRQESVVSRYSVDWAPLGTGTYTPDPLLGPQEQDISDVPRQLDRMTTIQSTGHMGDALENLARTMTTRDYHHDTLELQPTISRRRTQGSTLQRRPSSIFPDEAGSQHKPVSQGLPPEFRNLSAEIIFVLVCSAGQLLFAWFLGDVNVNQTHFKDALGIKNSQLPWLVGAFNVANAISIILSGSLTDLLPPKNLVVGAFAWLTVWNIVGAFSLSPSRAVLFFVVRAMQGLAIGVLVSGSMSILGRVYAPGLRKTRVFSFMAAAAPFGFWLGAMQGGVLSSHLPWIFGSNAMLCGALCTAAFFTIPALSPVADAPGTEVPSLRQFDYLGGICAIFGFVCLLFGLTQGGVASWSPYTYVLVIVGVLSLGAFFYVESRVARPLIPNGIWKTKGFTPLMAAYVLGFGAYMGPWQFYAIQFWLRIQGVSSLTVALYLLPNALVGVLATYIVSRLMHRVPGHWIYVFSMVAFALGPVFFLPQTRNTNYFALSMPGVALATFGPDLSFAAASIFITSNVARSYQGSAGSLLMTIQNLSAAIMTSVADAIGQQVDVNDRGEVEMKGLRAIWWFGFSAAMLGAAITIFGVRIPKEEEKEHAR